MLVNVLYINESSVDKSVRGFHKVSFFMITLLSHLFVIRGEFNGKILKVKGSEQMSNNKNFSELHFVLSLIGSLCSIGSDLAGSPCHLASCPFFLML